MTDEMKQLYKQIVSYYFTPMKNKYLISDDIERAWYAQQIRSLV